MVGAMLHILGTFLAFTGLFCAPLLAQSPATPTDATAQEETQTAPAPSVSASSDESLPVQGGDVAYIQRDGKWVAVPAATLFPELAADAAANAEREPAAVYISSLSIDGDVVGDFAEMTADIGIEVTREGEWLEVPLGLQQAHVYESEHEGPGDSVRATGLPPEDGVHWLLKGKGSHSLRCRFRLPVKTSPAGSQLQLTLPSLPAGFYARAVVRIPDERAVLRASADTADYRSRVLDGGVTEFDCDVKGSRWDLGWRTAVDDQPALTQTSYLRVGRSDGELRLQIRQQCDLSQGRLTELLARIPTGFSLRDVERQQGVRRERLMWTTVDERPGWVRIALSPPVEVSESLELNWDLVQPFPEGGGEVRLEGVQLDAAGQQTGTIELEAVEGYTLSPPTAESNGIYQRSTSEPRSGTAAPVLRTFEFQRQPFLLAYHVEPVQPRLLVQQRQFLWLETDHMELHLRLDATVEAGQVSELEFDWPGWSATDWAPRAAMIEVTVDAGSATEVVQGTIEPAMDGESPDRFRLRLARACGGRLQAMLTFSRAIPDHETNLELVLPRLSGPVYTQSSSLAVAGAVPLDIEVSGAPMSVSSRAPLPQNLPAGFADQSEYDVGKRADPIQIGWTEHPRTVSAAASITGSEISDRSLRVVEEIAYDVRHGEIETLLLKVPESLVGALSMSGPALPGAQQDVGVQFRLADGPQLLPEVTNDQVQLRLPRPETGSLVLQVDFLVALPAVDSEGRAEFSLPIVRSLDADFATTLLRMDGPETIEIAAPESEWKVHETRSGVSAWSTKTQPNSVRLRLDETALRTPQSFTIDAAFVRTRFDDAGASRTEAEYAVVRAPNRLRLHLPETATNIDIAWNGQPLSPDDGVRSVRGEPGTFVLRLPVPGSGRDSGRLAVTYQQQLSSSLPLLTRTNIEYPQFDDAATVTESLCEIVLPPGQQLYDPPRGLMPQYEWRRQAALWMRTSTAEYRSRRERLGIAPITERGNVYAFSAFGNVNRAEFGSMAQSLIVLMGAGLMLLLGFLFGRIPATRNVLSVLALAFVFVLLSVWYLELMQLLLQPALLGMLLASAAALFDGMTRRRRGAARSFDSGVERPHSAGAGRRSSIHGPGQAAHARTAVYQAEAVPGSGGGT
jgi:hypothetical protein